MLRSGVNKLRSVYILKYLFAEFQFFGAQFFQYVKVVKVKRKVIKSNFFREGGRGGGNN